MKNETLDWYQENAESFIGNTENVDMTEHYRAFLELVPSGGKILDLGCGAGSATVHFMKSGYQVTAVDGCAEMVDHTWNISGCQARQLLFEELDYSDVFDGVWACASLLHVHKAELPDILRLVHKALKEGGVLYASFKYGDEERVKDDGRLFSDFTEDSVRALFEGVGGFLLKNVWVSDDQRPERAGERWVNVLCVAEKSTLF
ncbi:MAG: class I SAM-dependent methyltransferase [Clostridiales bacterium]|nr:class I SAM-dependent methyltransferase [Clostridiales bacterium]